MADREEQAVQVSVKSRKVDEPAAVKKYAAEKFARLDKYSSALRAIDVMLQPDGGTFWSCEAIMHQDRHPTIVLSVMAGDLHSAVDLAIERAERMLTRGKERDSVRKHRRASSRTTASEE